MPSTLDAAVHVGREASFASTAAPTSHRSYEAQTDAHTLDTAVIQSQGFRRGLETTVASRRKQRPDGATGRIELDFMDTGMGLLLAAAFNTSTIGTVADALGLYTQTHTTAAPADVTPVTLYTQVVRPDTDTGNLHVFGYRGGVVTGWEISQALNEPAKFRLDLNYQKETIGDAELALAYSNSEPLDFSMSSVTLNGTAIAVTDFSLTADRAIKTDRRALQNSGLRRAPRRNGVPQYEGSLSGEFANLTLYNAFLNNTEMPLVVEWLGRGGRKLTISIPAVVLTGDTPQVSLDEQPSQALPFKVLWNGTNPAITVRYLTTDAAL